MSHLDEGTLHALLDGELDQAEQHQIQAHLDRCAACGTRLDDVKSVRGEADRLIAGLGAVDVSGAVPPKPAPLPVDLTSGPVLLIPDQPDSELRRERRHRILNWAAALFVVVGIGYLGVDIYGRHQLAALANSEADAPDQGSGSTLAAANAPVLSPTESMARDSAASASDPAPAESPSADAAAANSSEPETASAGANTRPGPPPPAALDLARAEKSSAVARAQGQAQQQPIDERKERELRSAAATADIDRARQQADAQRRRDEEQSALIERKVSERLAAERAATEQAAAAARPAPAPTPPSSEERAQITQRIGLDEAKRQLGSPLHGIEGMTPLFVGLTPGRNVPGMDNTRPVVRAVYAYASDQLVFLDQQRVRLGQSAGVETQLRKVIDDVVVLLHGEPAAGVLRNLAPRIQ